jgi:hypothetical protein
VADRQIGSISHFGMRQVRRAVPKSLRPFGNAQCASDVAARWQVRRAVPKSLRPFGNAQCASDVAARWEVPSSPRITDPGIP